MALLVLPTLAGRGWPRERDIIWQSDVEEAISGARTGYAQWTYPRAQYTLNINLLLSTGIQDWQALRGHYNLVKGRKSPWLFDDPDDDSVIDQNFGTGDGSTKTFQLVRTLGGFIEPIYAVNGSITVKEAGTTKSVTVNDGGTVTFGTAPGSGHALTWTGSYYWVCRFDNDTLKLNQFAAQMHEAQQVQFSTEKL